MGVAVVFLLPTRCCARMALAVSWCPACPFVTNQYCVKMTAWISSALAQRLPLACPMLCYKEIWLTVISPGFISQELFPKLRTEKNFTTVHWLSQLLSTLNWWWPFVYHTDHPPLCKAQWEWSSTSHGLSAVAKICINTVNHCNISESKTSQMLICSSTLMTNKQ